MAKKFDNICEDHRVRLTNRELVVLSLVSKGKSSQTVADRLYVSKRTIDFHLVNIYGKLNVKNRLDAIRRAARLGISLLGDSPEIANQQQAKAA